ncbi:MAG: GPP34 family phosphoprotein [Candidatus Odinarchaeota archaeon]
MILDEGKGKRYSRASTAKDLGLAGAFLMDLFLKGKILIEKKRIKVSDSSTTGDETLDEVFNIIKTSKKTRKVMNWIEQLARKHKAYSQAFYKRLEDQGILIIEEKKILEIFSTHRFYLQRPEVKTILLEQIENTIMHNMKPGPDLICLLSLLRVSNLIKVYIAKHYRKLAKRKIDELVQSEILDENTREMILVIIKSIQDIIAARVTAATTAATVV